MADISSYITGIESASRGEQVRDSIIRALQAINNDASEAASGTNLEEVQSLLTEGTYYDDEPVENSVRAVKSGALYNILGDIGLALDTINGISV